jgi:cysteine dioxygenase
MIDGSITWEYMIERLLQLFDGESVNIEEVEDLLASYKSDPKDWHKFAKFDKYKYTRNLVHEGNGKFNLVRRKAIGIGD